MNDVTFLHYCVTLNGNFLQTFEVRKLKQQMKKFKTIALSLLIITISIFSTPNKLFSQSVEFGVRLMPTISSFKMKSSSGASIKGEATLGFGFGALIGFKISDHAGIQVEAIYNSLNQNFEEQAESRKINLRYFNIPMLFSLHSGKLKTVNFSVVAGPQLGISAGSSITTSENYNPGVDEPVLSVKNGDLGLAYGAGVDIALDSDKKIRLGFGYRGVMGLIDISDESNTIVTDTYYVLEKTTIKTHSVYVGLSILF